MSDRHSSSFRTTEMVTHTLGTLGSGVAQLVATRVDGSRLQGITLAGIWEAVSFLGKTVGEGPLTYGFSIGLSAAQVSSRLSADPQGAADEAGMDDAELKAIPCGFISATDSVSLSPSPQSYRKIPGSTGWKVREGDAVSSWVHSHFGSSLTTGTVMKRWLVIKGRWLPD